MLKHQSLPAVQAVVVSHGRTHPYTIPKHMVTVFLDYVLVGTQEIPVPSKQIPLPTRVVIDLTAHFRCEGYPIGSDNRGYWWSHTAEELDHSIRFYERRSETLLETISALRFARNVVGGMQ